MRFFEGTLAAAYLLHISGALVSTHYITSKISQPCTSFVGQCIALGDCPTLQEEIRKEILAGASIMDIFRNSSCDLVGGKFYVCCPFTEETSTERDSAKEEHPNLQLLRRDICGVDFSDRILGGKEAHLKQFPWMALLQIEKDDDLMILCGGSLINEHYVLTAAHCLNNNNKRKRITVHLGEHNVLTDPDCDAQVCNDPVQIFGIQEFISHPQYDKRRKIGDIALIRLNRTASLNEYVSPICLPPAKSLKKHVQRSLFVAGWGAREIEMASDVKQWVKVPVVNNNKCEETFHISMDETLMCAGSVEGEATCIGDSGGPLMIQESVVPFRPGEQWVAEAVVQGGTWLCGTKGVPGLYTRVSPYVNWILDNMKP